MEGYTDLLSDVKYRISDSKRAEKLKIYVKVTPWSENWKCVILVVCVCGNWKVYVVKHNYVFVD